MKALLLIAIVGVAATAMGIGFLNAPKIDVVAQDVGVGHDTLTHPITTAIVAFHITAEKHTDQFLNKYDACLVKSPNFIASGATIFCKLTNMAAQVVAEGNVVLTHNLPAGQTIQIGLPHVISAGSTLVSNIQDVTIVVQDKSP